VSSLDVRVQLSTESAAGEPVSVLAISAVNHTDAPVSVWACLILTTFGARLYLEPHLDYPLTLQPGEWCREWVACDVAARELRARGCKGETRLIALFLEPLDRRARLVSMMVGRGSMVDVRGIEHRSDSFLWNVDR
jgi:hypothetical protein